MTAQSAQRISLAAEPPDEGCRHLISSVIETQIIPRLLQAHPSGAGRLAQETHQTIRIPESDVVEFANLCLLNDAILANSFDEESIREGVAAMVGNSWESELDRFRSVDLQELPRLRAI